MTAMLPDLRRRCTAFDAVPAVVDSIVQPEDVLSGISRPVRSATGPPVGSQEGYRIALAVAQRVGEGADATRTADAIIALWQQIEAALAPIIGQRGVVALYKRSLHLATAAHPWLELQEQPQATMDLAALKSAMVRQDSADAVAGGVAMLQTFQTLLNSLIGSSLTGRLLDAVWTHPSPSSNSPAQDPSS